ncbi:anti-sigma-I factor RsgI family protein [Lachnoclostridium sp. An169]|uniref:anti-sigma-I factor RsgI family protein n=1 Tax=Lachnoclostridium sp. An169 TaxID=1965569 RepID=UPI003FA568F2
MNPSLELGVNRFDRIISVEGYNDDGTALAASLNIRFLDYQDAIEQLLEDETVESYLSGDAVMSLTVAGKSESQSSTILENVESCVSDQENVRCHSGDVTEMHDAHECGMSFGKYQAFLRLQELDPAVTADDVRDLSMREILDLIEEYSKPSDSAGDPDNAGDIPGSCSNDGSVETSGNSSRGHENGHGSHH